MKKSVVTIFKVLDVVGMGLDTWEGELVKAYEDVLQAINQLLKQRVIILNKQRIKHEQPLHYHLRLLLIHVHHLRHRHVILFRLLAIAILPLQNPIKQVMEQIPHKLRGFLLVYCYPPKVANELLVVKD